MESIYRQEGETERCQPKKRLGIVSGEATFPWEGQSPYADDLTSDQL